MLQSLKQSAVKLFAKLSLPTRGERDEMAHDLSRSYTQLDREAFARLVIEEVIDDLKRRVDREREI